MERTERDCFEDEYFEGALRELDRLRQSLSPIWKRRVRALSFPVKETASSATLLFYHRYTLSSSM
jgi:hypothetical protein